MGATASGRRLTRNLPGHLQGRRGWENLYSRFVEMNEQGNRCPSIQVEAAGRDRGITYYDQICATEIECREEVRQELWSAHFQFGDSTVALHEHSSIQGQRLSSGDTDGAIVVNSVSCRKNQIIGMPVSR